MARLRTRSISPPLRIVFLYALFSLVWILCSDSMLELLARSDGDITRYQHYKGAAFVIVSAILLYSLLRNEQRFRDKMGQAQQQAKEEAEAANKAKDHFLAVLSHELRTPLTPVLALVSAGEQPVTEEERRQHIQIIRRNIELEARLIDDLLDLTRVTRGKVRLDLRPLDLRTALQHVVEMCRAELEAKRLDLQVSYAGEELPVFADAARLQQVFWNVIRNGIKYSPAGAALEIVAHAENGSVLVEVRDHGVGIEKAALERIFAPFEQASPQPPAAGGGLGLGLTIARAMVTLHGGHIEAASAGVGRGSTFRITLPMVPMSGPNCSSPIPVAPPAPPAAAVPVEGLSVLLVEDHPDTCLIMQRLLKRRGHRVKTAGDVEEALKLFARESFSVLLSDLGLPGRSGLDLIRDLRRSGSRIPAIAVSGFGRDEDIRDSLAAGFDEHITKPVNFARLEETMMKVVSSRA